ncbi:MFS transporter [Microbacteriaceae bacterium VKM Ac-2855]|nr:MFS transporter [Microbacteriaceae bacterium VKM Ac-2855]
MSSTSERPFRIGPMLVSAFLPTFLFSVGEGAIIPLIPVAANDLGASLAIAGVISSMIMLGELVGDVPSGWIVSRIGERAAMLWASVLSAVGLVVCLLSTSWIGLTIGIFLIGLATAVFVLARQAFMTSFVPLKYRARALSSLAGVFRAGWFIGPFLAAGVVHLTGSVNSVFWIHLICCAAAALILLFLVDPAAMIGERPSIDPEAPSNGLFRTIAEHRGVLLRMGLGAALIGGLRSSRTVILPLWALSIGLPEANTALIVGTAGAVDFALFYVSGQIMDRFGRGWSAIPSMIGLGAGHLILAFSHDAANAVTWLIVVAMLLAVANGIGSGILMTLGADLAPPADPAPFLGAYRFTGDVGNAAAPLAVAGITAVASISLAAGTMGVLGLLGAGLLARWLPRYSPRPVRR